jgi:hypothetical protein
MVERMSVSDCDDHDDGLAGQGSRSSQCASSRSLRHKIFVATIRTCSRCSTNGNCCHDEISQGISRVWFGNTKVCSTGGHEPRGFVVVGDLTRVTVTICQSSKRHSIQV